MHLKYVDMQALTKTKAVPIFIFVMSTSATFVRACFLSLICTLRYPAINASSSRKNLGYIFILKYVIFKIETRNPPWEPSARIVLSSTTPKDRPRT